MNNDLEILNSIQTVEAPPFLMSKIEKKMLSRKKELMPRGMSFTLSAAAVLLILFNLKLMYSSFHDPASKTNITVSMNLFQDNSLYK